MMNLAKRIYSGIIDRYRRYTFRPYVIRRNFAGEEFQFQIGDLFGQSAYRPQHTSWPELEWIKANAITSGDTVVDCGANHGFSTVLFAKWTGARGKVHAFEPFSHNMAILKENLRLNEITNVICHQSALGAASGNALITTHPNARIVQESDRIRGTEQVSLVALDDIIPDQSIDFIKIDVEGFELDLLKGAQRILASRPRLDVELHVSYYNDKESELGRIFGLIPMDRYNVHIQIEVDGPIVPFETERHTLEALSRCEVVHLFCC